MAGDAPGAAPAGTWRFITANTGLMAELTALRTWNPSAGIVTSSSIGKNGPSEVSIPNPRTLVRDLSAAITSKDHFARNGSGVLYVYRDGVYQPSGEMWIRQQVKHLLLDHDCTELWSRALTREVVEFISLDVPELPEQPATELINLENGLLRFRTRELIPHSPEFLSSIRIPIRFDPEATCPEIERFIAQVFPEDGVPLAWEILGDLLTPDRSIQKAICLVGQGGNGKSAFLDLATNFVGTENVCHISLQRLESDRFSAARLYGKLANICPDLPSEGLTTSATFKAITGGDRITTEFKYCDSFEFMPFARLLFSANRLPASNDASQAFFDRWLIVPFPNRFRHTRGETPRTILQRRLCTPNRTEWRIEQSVEGASSGPPVLAGLRNQRRVESQGSGTKPRTMRSRPGLTSTQWRQKRRLFHSRNCMRRTHRTAANAAVGRYQSRPLGACSE